MDYLGGSSVIPQEGGKRIRVREDVRAEAGVTEETRCCTLGFEGGGWGHA